MSQEIIFIIDKKGRVKQEDAKGFGSSCQEATEAIERLLGTPDESSRALTDSYYEAPPEQLLQVE